MINTDDARPWHYGSLDAQQEASRDAMDSVYSCPVCGEANEDNWPVRTEDGSIQDGGCQLDWEKQCSETWWETHNALAKATGDAS
jgi:hypothetical protein